MASFAPSRARPSATAFPSPWLDAATSATLSFDPRSTSSLSEAAGETGNTALPFFFPAPQIGIRLIHPIHPDRRKDIDVARIFQAPPPVRHVRWNQQHFALAGDHFAPFEFELQRAF